MLETLWFCFFIYFGGDRIGGLGLCGSGLDGLCPPLGRQLLIYGRSVVWASLNIIMPVTLRVPPAPLWRGGVRVCDVSVDFDCCVASCHQEGPILDERINPISREFLIIFVLTY